MPGAARQQVTLFCLPKIQVTKQKGTPPHRPFGLPSVFRANRAAALNSAFGLRQTQPTAPHSPGKPRRCRGGLKRFCGRSPCLGALPAGEGGFGVVLLFGPLGPPPERSRPGDFCEDCLSAKREFRSRPVRRAAQGTREGRWIGAAFFGYLSLAVERKVTSRRAAPGTQTSAQSASKPNGPPQPIPFQQG